MLNFTTGFIAILTQLRRAVAAFAARQEHVPPVTWLGAQSFVPIMPPDHKPRLATETWLLLATRLGRLATRFQALFDRWRAGTLPKPRPSRAGRPYRARTGPRLPGARGWVNARVAEAAPCAGMLGHLLHDPDLPSFLAAAPQAGRLLRPLCRMLALDPPACLRPPPSVTPATARAGSRPSREIDSGSKGPRPFAGGALLAVCGQKPTLA